jgi:hypothetical protein
MRKISLILLASAFLGLTACAEKLVNPYQGNAEATQVHTYLHYFKDANGRYVHLHGANVSGSSKLPASLDPLTYVGKPFPLDEAEQNFRTLRAMGFNAMRMPIIWEGIEPNQRGEYDEDYLNYIAEIVRLAGDYGIYVQLDMHQDMFSRWLQRYYNDGQPVNALTTIPGLEKQFANIFNDVNQGDGAPKWVVQLALPDKNVGGPQWGLPFSMVSDTSQTDDVLDTQWGLNLFASVDVARCFATFLAGPDVFPNYQIDGQNIGDYLQDAYTQAWVQVAQHVRGLPNVIGYDVMNEPLGIYYILLLYALLYQQAEASPDGTLTDQQVQAQIDAVIDQCVLNGMASADAAVLEYVWSNLQQLPRTAAQFAAAGLPLHSTTISPYTPSLTGVLGTLINFNRTYLDPLYSRVGQAIQDADPNAIIFIEPSIGLDDTSGIFGEYITPMLAPDGVNQLVFAPHFYADIYPFVLQVNPPPRDFTVNEVRNRDYTSAILSAVNEAEFSLGYPPVVMGEFGTYFNFGGIQTSIAHDYDVSAAILDNYYRVLDAQMISRQVWCYSPENTTWWGDGWNREDFSVLGPNRQPRGSDAYSRVMPRATSGRLVSFQYNSPLAYYEPQPGVPTPFEQFTLEMAGLETSAPTEIFVPASKFTQGFYVYVSDGACYYDPDPQILFWLPSNVDPTVHHTIRIRPPWPNYGDTTWNYFFDGNKVESRP